MSSNHHALIQDVIPYIDILTEHLDKFRDDALVSRAVRAAAERGGIMLNQYYSRTDEVRIYRIAMRTLLLLIVLAHSSGHVAVELSTAACPDLPPLSMPAFACHISAFVLILTDFDILLNSAPSCVQGCIFPRTRLAAALG